MFETMLKTEERIEEGQAVRCEYCASGKLLVRKTDGALLGMTDPLPAETVRSHFISYKRPLYGVVTKTDEKGSLLHMVAPGRIKGEFTAIHDADIIPFPVLIKEEEEGCAA